MTGIGRLAVDLRGGVDPVHVGHLDVGDDEVGVASGAELDQLPAGLGRADDLVAQKRQDLLEIVAHVALVIGDGDLERTGHDGPFGNVSRKTAPGSSPSPSAIRPPWASTIRLAMAIPRPVPLALVVKNGSKILGRCSGGDSGAVVAHANADRRPALESSVLCRADLDHDGRRTSGQCVLQDVAEDLPESKRIHRAAQVDAVARLAQDGLFLARGGLEVGPGLAPDLPQVARLLVEVDRRGVAANVFVESVQVILGLLEPR